MGETKIEWATYSHNFWVGCTKVSAACDFCYAESWAKRSGHPDLWNGERRRTKTWAEPHKWNKMAMARPKVFANSLSDFFDNQVPEQWRADAWDVIGRTPHLDWLILTKRPQNIAKMLPAGWNDRLWPNVWLGTTVENQEEADRRIPHLLAVPAARHFLSMEPLLGPVNLKHPWLGWKCCVCSERAGSPNACGDCDPCIGTLGKTFIDWVIVGGESGGKARPMHPDWARSLRDQCAAAGVPFHFKQWGEWAPGECGNGPPTRTERVADFWAGSWNFGTQTPRESAEGHRDDEPDVYRLGKKASGRLLDGIEHNGTPS